MGLSTYAKSRLPTKDDIDVSEKNESGYPLASIWRFEGFVSGAGRFSKIE
jgi:hypothetical protein